MNPTTIKAPKAKLQPGKIYSGDNGTRICVHCAGQSAIYTGRDTSGQKVRRFTQSDAADWFSYFGKALACECGKTSFQSLESLFA